MTTYHVDPEDGVDSNAGTSAATALENLRYAQQLISAGDKIVLENSPPNPCRLFHGTPSGGALDVFELDTAMTMEAANRILRPAVTSAVDISNGVARGNLLLNPTHDQWTGGDDTQTEWANSAAGTLSKETSVTYNSGATAIKAVGGVNDFTGIAQEIYLPSGLNLRMSGAIRVDGATRYTAYRFWDNVADEYFNWQDASWGADSGDRWIQVGNGGVGVIGSYYFATSGSAAFPEDILTQNSGRHTVKASAGFKNMTWYADDMALTPIGEHEYYNWTADSTADVYYVDKLHFTPLRVLICSEENWQLTGIAAFNSHEASLWRHHSLANCRANESSHYYDSSIGRLYIHVPSGIDLSTMHIESYPNGALLETAEDITIKNIDVMGAIGVVNPLGATIPNQSDLYGVRAYSCILSFASNADKMRGTQCKSYWTRIGYTSDSNTNQDQTCGDYLSNDASAVMELFGCVAQYCADEGYQAAQASTMACYGCVALDGLLGTQTQNGAAHGFKIGETEANCIGIYQNCTALNMQNGSGFLCPADAGASAEWTAEGCVADSTFAGFNLKDGVAGAAVLTCSNCITDTYTETNSTAWTLGSGNQSVEDADIEATGVGPTGALESDSPAVGVGTKWWGAVVRPAGANGEPYPDVNLDKGGMQSTHSLTHPLNA